MAKDALDEMIEERERKSPGFKLLVEEALARRELARKLAAIRERKDLTQAVVAKRMKTAASVVSKFEAGGDVKLSTLQRYCAAIETEAPLALKPARNRTAAARRAQRRVSVC